MDNTPSPLNQDLTRGEIISYSIGGLAVGGLMIWGATVPMSTIIAGFVFLLVSRFIWKVVAWTFS
jgi:hypothetical protein